MIGYLRKVVTTLCCVFVLCCVLCVVCVCVLRVCAVCVFVCSVRVVCVFCVCAVCCVVLFVSCVGCVPHSQWHAFDRPAMSLCLQQITRFDRLPRCVLLFLNLSFVGGQLCSTSRFCTFLAQFFILGAKFCTQAPVDKKASQSEQKFHSFVTGAIGGTAGTLHNRTHTLTHTHTHTHAHAQRTRTAHKHKHSARATYARTQAHHVLACTASASQKRGAGCA